MGAHTQWGGYVIDYRKVRNFNCPDLVNNRVCDTFYTRCHSWSSSFASSLNIKTLKPRSCDEARLTYAQLTPFVTRKFAPQEYDRPVSDKEEFIAAWKRDNPKEYQMRRQVWADYLVQTGVLVKSEKQHQGGETSQIEGVLSDFEDDINVQARENAIVEVEDPGKHRTVLGRPFRR